uniref:Uncharacterized protein n=1 Tax=Cacopsylla melanoneura TaxID=428564 RepID=A0A8D8Z6D3_9HEMI
MTQSTHCVKLMDFLSNQTCKNILKKHLPSTKHQRHYRTFLTNLYCVFSGYKCGYLIDKVSVERDTILNIVQQIVLLELFLCHIRIVIINEDIVVLNVESFLNHLSTKQVFINVSSELSYPVLLTEDTQEVIQIKTFLHKTFNNTEPEVKITIVEQGNLCVPTLVGLLLNFPIVYWHREDFDFNSVPLSVYKIMITPQSMGCSSQMMELYSFSSPVQFDNDTLVRQFVNCLIRKLRMGGVSVELIQTKEQSDNVSL